VTPSGIEPSEVNSLPLPAKAGSPTEVSLWAFSEAAVLFLRDNPEGQKFLSRLEKKHDKGKALTILAHKLARAVYYMLKRKVAFDMKRFLND
jgi:hypothetical protein